MTTEALDPRMAEFVGNLTEQTRVAMKIQGFGPDDPPSPPFDPAAFREVKPAPPDPDWPTDDPTPSPEPRTLPESPLVALGQRTAARARSIEAADLATAPVPNTELWVAGPKANYRGQPVELSASEQAAVAQIVLRAIKNRIEAQYAEVVGSLPRRVRVRREKPSMSVAPEAPKKKRGRPKKEKPNE